MVLLSPSGYKSKKRLQEPSESVLIENSIRNTSPKQNAKYQAKTRHLNLEKEALKNG